MADKHLYDCNNVEHQKIIANNHRISQSTFESYLNNFWNTPTPNEAPTIKTWDELNDAMSGVACTEMRWKLEMDENDNSSNNIDMVLVPVETTETIKNYSIALFNGVKALHNNVVEFQFYKARKGDNSPDIIFMAVNNMSQPVFFGDLTDLHP